MTYAICLPAPPPREPNRPSLRELIALLPVGDPERHQRMINAAERLYPLEYRPPLERQSRFRPVYA